MTRYAPVDQYRPFYTRGNTHRDGFLLDRAGWYFVDDRNVLSGPFTTRMDCLEMVKSARQEFATS